MCGGGGCWQNTKGLRYLYSRSMHDDVRMMQSIIATLWSYLDVFSRVLLEVFCPGGRIIGMQGVVGEGGSC